jgi:hypothetical protein
MVFSPRCRNKVVCNTFPEFQLGDRTLQFVKEFKYLGHILTNNAMDDVDIKREIRNMFMRTNILIRKYSKCSVIVKILLFKSFCLCMYDTALWSRYKTTTLNKLKSCYNKCIKLFFGYMRSYSVTQMLFELGLPSFSTVLCNGAIVFNRMCYASVNKLISNLNLVTNCVIHDFY